MKEAMKKVMCFGAFDGLHPGHLDFFRQAKRYGDFLIVSVGSFSTNIKSLTGFMILHPEGMRDW